MVPPCFTAPLRAWPCVPGWTRPLRGNGRTRRGLGGVPLHPHSSEAIFHPVLTCPVPSFGLSVRRRRGVLSSSRLFAFCQRGTRPPCSYYNTQKRRVCQPGQGTKKSKKMEQYEWKNAVSCKKRGLISHKIRFFLLFQFMAPALVNICSTCAASRRCSGASSRGSVASRAAASAWAA